MRTQFISNNLMFYKIFSLPLIYIKNTVVIKLSNTMPINRAKYLCCNLINMFCKQFNLFYIVTNKSLLLIKNSFAFILKINTVLLIKTQSLF